MLPKYVIGIRPIAKNNNYCYIKQCSIPKICRRKNDMAHILVVSSNEKATREFLSGAVLERHQVDIVSPREWQPPPATVSAVIVRTNQGMVRLRRHPSGSMLSDLDHMCRDCDHASIPVIVLPHHTAGARRRIFEIIGTARSHHVCDRDRASVDHVLGQLGL